MQAGSIIIAPKIHHATLMQQLLLEQEVLTDIQIIPLSTFLTTTISKEEDYFNCAHILTSLKSSLTILSPYIDHPLFIEEILKFHNYFSCFRIPLDSLPEEYDTEKEIKYILQAMKDFQTTQIQQYNYACQLSFEQLSSIYISEYFISDILEHQIISMLLRHGASLLPLSTVKLEHSEIYKASNQRIETEGIIQYLIQNIENLEKTLLVYTDASYQTLLPQILKRYQVPFQLLTNQQPSRTINRFIYLLDFITHFDIPTFITILENDCLALKNPQAFSEYVTYFSLSPLDVLTKTTVYLAESFVSFNSANQAALQQMVKTAEKDIDTCISFLTQAQECYQNNNLIETCQYLYTFLASQTVPNDEESIFSQLALFLETNLPLLKNAENAIEQLKHFLLQIQIQKENALSGLTITNTHSFLFNHYDTIILLGTSSNYFPNVPTFQGIIDETYLAKISAFPNAEYRYHQYMTQIKRIFSSSKQLIMSYSYGDYNGKGKECAFEIEDFAQTHNITIKEIPILENNPNPYHNETLPQEIAQKLFFKQKQLYGSISSFETYFKCPYSYFLKYGLHLYNESYPEIGVAQIGTMMHSIMEDLINKKGKEYANTTISEIKEEVQTAFRPYHLFFKKHPSLLDLTISKLTNLLFHSFQFLKELEEHSAFIPIHSEYKFSHTIAIDEFEVQLNGSIDRIDEHSTYFRILDLKSSNHSLSETKICAGLQLQLLSYAWVYQQLSNKKLMGVYYFSFTSGNIATNAYKVLRSQKTVEYLDESTYFELFRKQKQFKGWTFDNPVMLDDDANHINDLRINKEGAIVVYGGNYPFPKVEQFIHEIYTYLVYELWEGHIPLTPVEDACTYCDYPAICQFKGHQERPTSKVSFKSFKKEEEYEME